MLAYILLVFTCAWKTLGELNLLHMVQQNKLNTPISTVRTTSIYVKIGCLQKLLLSLCENQRQPLQEVLLLELNNSWTHEASQAWLYSSSIGGSRNPSCPVQFPLSSSWSVSLQLPQSSMQFSIQNVIKQFLPKNPTQYTGEIPHPVCQETIFLCEGMYKQLQMLFMEDTYFGHKSSV